MAVVERTVRQLRLRAASATWARRGALCVEDALRCASLPDTGAALLLVRRLSLGRIDAIGASQTVALRIEQRLRELAPHWCRGELGDAVQAEAVWFADRASALGALLLRLAEGRPVSAWYWSRLLPADLAPPGTPPTLRATLLALAREPCAAAALPAAVAAVLQHGGRASLQAALDATEAQTVLAAAGISDRPARWIDALSALEDVRAPPRPPRQAAPAAEPAPPHTLDANRLDRPMPAQPTPGPCPDAARSWALVPAKPEPGAAAAAPGAAAAPQRLAQPLFDRSLPTAAGGCLFLLPVLARLGMADRWAEAEPALAETLAARVLQQALQRLRLGADDPAWALCTLPPDAQADAAAAGWLRDLRHALRRRFGIGLASLVLRPGWLALTRTHADMHFALAATDLRVRRHGLDLDPGWLPWFGRVVSFHFDHR